MADINPRMKNPPPRAKPARNGRDETRLLEAMELLFFAYRDFTGDSDRILESLGFGRAHHRTLHFIGRHPGISVTGLLRILRITKQSLARVLRRLLEEGFVEQHSDSEDGRRRRLFLSSEGKQLLNRLRAPQRRRLRRALDSQNDFEQWREVMLQLVNESERDHVVALMNGKAT